MRQTHASFKVTKNTKFWGMRCSPELALRSTDFYRLENLIFTTLARDLSDKHVRWKSIGHTVDLKAIEKINLRPNFFCRKNWFHSLHSPGGLEPFFRFILERLRRSNRGYGWRWFFFRWDLKTLSLSL